MALEAKVAAVLSDREIAINAGRFTGVSVDDFAVVQHVTDVKDPDSNEILGHVRRPAIRMRVVEVQDFLSVARVVEPTLNVFDVVIGGGSRLKVITSNRSNVADGVVLVQPGFFVVIEAKVANDPAAAHPSNPSRRRRQGQVDAG